MTKLKPGTRQALTILGRSAVSSAVSRTEDYWDEQQFLYNETLNALWRDPALANRAYSEISMDLWALLDNLIKQRDQYALPKALESRIADFAAQLLRGTEDYEVGFVIDGLALPEEITVGKTEFVHFDTEKARAWGVDEHEPFAAGIVGRTMALVRVQAGSYEKAWELAADEIDTALNIVRASMASSQAAAPNDELFLQHRDTRYLAKRLSDEHAIRYGIYSRFGVIDLDLRGNLSRMAPPLIQAARDLGREVVALYDHSLSARLSCALLRALDWIGSSVTRENYDDKIVDLCTAMESMLAVKSDRLKGEAIALRYILLQGYRGQGGGHFISPHAVLPIYNLRSDIIHGSKRRVAGHDHYWVIREIAMRTLKLILDLGRTEPQLKSVKDIIDLLEGDAERIRAALWILDSDKSKDDRQVEKYGREILGRLDAHGTTDNGQQVRRMTRSAGPTMGL